MGRGLVAFDGMGWQLKCCAEHAVHTPSYEKASIQRMTHARGQGGLRHMLVTQGELATATHHVTEVAHNVHVDAQFFLGLQMQGEGWCGGKALM